MRTYIGTLISGFNLMYIFLTKITPLHTKMLCFVLHAGQKKMTTVYIALNVYNPEQYQVYNLNYTKQLPFVFFVL